MTCCPKCPTGRMAGPTFVTDVMHGERLLYRCMTCGYEFTTPCVDAKTGRFAGDAASFVAALRARTVDRSEP